MALEQWWMLIVAAGLALVALAIGVVLGLRKRAERPEGGAVAVARAERVRALPSFRAAVRRRMMLMSGVIALSLAAVGVAGVVASRPMTSETIQPVNTNRDIMLCLDVSGSMSEVDVEVLGVFLNLLDELKGERIGLTIFNSSPVQIFPLTDDYAFMKSHLESMIASFDYRDPVPEHWVGTLNGNGASLIGDGLASCTLRFDHPDDKRSRSIILATDNEVNGASIVTLPEAAAYAKSLGVRVFALNPVQADDDPNSQELISAAQSTGGQAYGLRDTTSVDEIVADVQAQDAAALRGEAQVVWHDQPEVWMAILLVLSASVVVLLWRVRA